MLACALYADGDSRNSPVLSLSDDVVSVASLLAGLASLDH